MISNLSKSIRPADRQSTMALDDGRLMAWSEWGDKAAQPVLFFTGAGMSGSLGFGTDVLEALNIRLIAPDRPGLGRSDFDPSKTLRSTAKDTAALLDGLRVETCPAIAFSQGAPFALTFAADGRVSSLALVSGQDDLRDPEHQSAVPEQVKQMLDQAEQDPSGFVAMIEGFADADGFYDLIMSMSSEIDREYYGDETFASAYKRVLREGFAQGPGGYALDTLSAMRCWSFRLSDVTCPVGLWCGGKDTSPVHSPDHGASLAKRLPNAECYFFEDEGGALLWSRSKDILRSVLPQ